MNHESKHIELFDKYLQDLMSPEERRDFEKQLAMDKDMAMDFEVHKILLEGIKESGRQELKNYLKTNGTVLFWGSNVWPKSMRFAAAAVFIIMAGLYFVIKSYVKTPESREIAVEPSQKQVPLVPLDSNTFDKFDKEDAVDHTEVVPSPLELAVIEQEFSVTEESPEEASDNIEDMNRSYQNENKYLDVTDSKWRETADDNEIVNVLSEKKLKDTLVKAPILLALAPTEVMRMKTVQNAPATGSTSTDTEGFYKKKAKQLPANVSNQVQSNKLESDAILMDSVILGKGNTEIKNLEKETKAESSKTYIVEFWSSPINFKGYSLVNNYLKLYGLDSKHCNWYVYQNNLYVREKKNVYALTPCQESCAFKAVTDTAIKNYILQQK